MDHIRVNLTNFVVMGLSSVLFLAGSLYVMVFLSTRSVPVVSPVATLLLRPFQLIPAA